MYEIIATPFSTSFDHRYSSDEAYFNFNNGLKYLISKGLSPDLPQFGLGHSLGSLFHILICNQYATDRTGNILMSFNNKPASQVFFMIKKLILI